jgi:hypothetical protein
MREKLKPKTAIKLKRYRCRNCKKKLTKGLPPGTRCDKCLGAYHAMDKI